jgi:hypothetical protein
LHVAVLGGPDFFFLQAAVKAFDVAVAFRVIIGRASMGDYQPIQGFDPARRWSGAIYESGHFYFAQPHILILQRHSPPNSLTPTTR